MVDEGRARSGASVRVQLRYLDGCPHVDEVRGRLGRALARLEVPVDVEEVQGPCASPTVLVDGRDVTDRAADGTPSCRLELPTEHQIISAVRSAPAGHRPGRRLGPVGTVARFGVGAALVAAALLIGAGRLDALVGLVVANLVAVVVLSLRGRHAPPLQAIGPTAHCLNCVAGVAFFIVLPLAAMLFYGSAMIIAAVAGAPGCEISVVSNLLRGRHDEIGCPVFGPFDARDTGSA